MPKCLIDGQEVEFSVGENLVEVARRAGIEIPVFCYHPGLSVVAQCRMCAVEIEKAPKLQTACSTVAQDGMVVKTKSEKVKQNQKAIMEFLLLNHPLDCPVCDKAGECDLQDHSYKYGESYTRYSEEKRTYVDLEMGPVIKKNMNRCIHCTRCIRFGAQIAGVHEMIATNRGNHTEISTLNGRNLETEYAGNYADICPTGALTLKDFRFKKRAWFLTKKATICEGCSQGCSIELHLADGIVHRCVARENLKINKYWICDEGRFNYKYLADPDRVIEPMIKESGRFGATSWPKAVEQAKALLKDKNVCILVGEDLTQEEAALAQLFSLEGFPTSSCFHFGTDGVRSSKDDKAVDKVLKRKSKTANLVGLEKLKIASLPSSLEKFGAFLIIRGGRAQLPELPPAPVVAFGVFKEKEVRKFDIILPGRGFIEKQGTVFNYQGIEQSFVKILDASSETRELSDALKLWTGI
ncbi:MAG: hypothetical protein A3K03_00485 [Bdellovibrionales bacterium RIFOXYD1_FULL_44_7]|nr:MAG: hypothetical protein A3K03_00485 [Bdellovibrionales bacterium RIFOXYD1_FULL_44_7]